MGGCSAVSPTIYNVTVNSTNTVTLTSAPATTAQTVCINTPITNITYSTTGATGATVTNLPTGVTGTWAANVVTISGTPTVAGAALTYTVTLTGGCGVITTTGTIAVTANNTVALTSAPATTAQTVCINTPITNITYSYYRSNRCHSHQSTDRSDRYLGSECCNYQRYSDSSRSSTYLYSHTDRWLRSNHHYRNNSRNS